MTAAELNRQIEVSEQQRADLLPPQPKRRTGRAYRRMMNERKYKHLFKIVTHGYRPHAGYVDWSYVDGKWMPTGKYIKYPKNSNCQNWCKKASSARVRISRIRETAIDEFSITGGRFTEWRYYGDCRKRRNPEGRLSDPAARGHPAVGTQIR